MVEVFKLESKPERLFADWVNNKGFEAIKIEKRGWPDRLIVLNWGYSFYIEFKRFNDKFGKRKGEKLQQYVHKKLRKRGCHVYLVDNLEQAKEIFEYELAWSNNIMEMFKPFKELDKW